jgi:hypothetical protein
MMIGATILQRGRWAAAAAALGATMLFGATAAHADVAPAPTPAPVIVVPPGYSEPKCHWKTGWILREAPLPPVPFLIWVCDSEPAIGPT